MTAKVGLIEQEAEFWERQAVETHSLSNWNDYLSRAWGLRRALEIIEQGEVSETLTEEARP